MRPRRHAPSNKPPPASSDGGKSDFGGPRQAARPEGEESSPTPHDALFKAAFSRPVHARAVLRDIVPEALARRIDWATLRRRPGSFVNQELRENHTDLLFAVRIQRREARLYLLFEHQSTTDRWMLLRLLEYMLRIWRDHIARLPGVTHLPVILPIVLHHSETGWTCATDFEQLLDLDADFRADVKPYVPAFRIVLDDLSHASDEALRSRAITAFAKLVLGCLRHRSEMSAWVRELRSWSGPLTEVITAPDGMRALALVLRYMFRMADDVPLEDLRRFIIDAAGPGVAEEIVSLEQKLIDKGKEQGRVEGRAEVILKLLKLKFGKLPAGVIARVKAATDAEIDRWTERVLTAPTLAAVLDG